jgi:hypothetical protein
MFFLNLSATEFFTALGVLGGLTTALYLLDRRRRTRVVSTLRFWTDAQSTRESHRRKRVREPWSLFLQMASLLLLLLAIAQLQLGPREHRSRDHVLLLDTSAWGAQRSGSATLLDREKAMAERYLSVLPSADRIMLVRADALATPATPFTADRVQLLRAVRQTTAGFSALNLEEALLFAAHAQRWSRGEQGDVVYIGPGMVPESDTSVPKLKNLRVLSIEPDLRHIGIRAVGVRRSEADENAWQAVVTVKNYGPTRALARFETQFAGTAFAPRTVALNTGEETAAEYNFVTNSGGELIAQITPGDSLTIDQRVALELPRVRPLRVAVFTDRPQVLRPLFAKNDGLIVHFLPRSEAGATAGADLAVFDQTAPGGVPKTASIWIDPPPARSPLPVRAIVNDARITTWNSEMALGAGLHTKDRRIPRTEVFQIFDDDVPIGRVSQGAVVVARNAAAGHGKMAVIGFDPLASELRFEVTTPLLFANLLRWISPDVFRSVETRAERLGAVNIALDGSENPERIRIFNARGSAVPFFIRKQTLELFASRPDVLHVNSEDRERVISISVPDVAAFRWKPPANVATGLPASSSIAPGAIDLWKWLAIAAAITLYMEWMLFARRRSYGRRRAAVHSTLRPAREETELIAK